MGKVKLWDFGSFTKVNDVAFFVNTNLNIWCLISQKAPIQHLKQEETQHSCPKYNYSCCRGTSTKYMRFCGGERERERKSRPGSLAHLIGGGGGQEDLTLYSYL